MSKKTIYVIIIAAVVIVGGICFTNYYTHKREQDMAKDQVNKIINQSNKQYNDLMNSAKSFMK